MITLEEYRRELDLMEKQYGAEEELYPYIYMLLREVGMTQKYSVRNIAHAGSRDNEQGIYKNLFKGYASFPDIAIIDKEFQKSNQVNEEYYESEITKLYCCVEAKTMENELLDLGNEIKIMSGAGTVCIKGNNGAHYRYYQVLNEGTSKLFIEEYCGKTYKIQKTGNDYNICEIVIEYIDRVRITKEEPVELTVSRDEKNANFVIYQKEEEVFRFNYSEEDNKKWELVGFTEKLKPVNMIIEQDVFYITILKSSAVAYINNKAKELLKSTTEVTDEGQLIGILLWYGRVIYTNGKEWKYLEIVDFDKSDDGNNLANKRNELREKCVMVNKKEKYKWCEYFNNVSFEIKETPLINIDEDTTEIEWEDFKATLRYISKDWNKICKEKHNE